MIGPTPLLAILIHLLVDADREIRRIASETLGRIPVDSLRGFLATGTTR